jgi:lysophospholipase L1-like esterase
MRRISPSDLKCPQWDPVVAAAARPGFPWLEVALPPAVIVLLCLFHTWIMAAVVAVIAGGLLLLRSVNPTLRQTVDRAFASFAEWAGKVIAVILLAFPFFVVITSVRVFDRITGNDPLHLRDREAPTFWLPADSERRRSRAIRRMFCSERLTRGRLALLPLFLLGTFLVGATEVGLRVYGLGKPLLYVEDPDVGYYPAPDQNARYPGRVVSTNRFGMRSPDIAMPKPAGITRILLIGDSTLAGTRVANDELYSSVMESELNAAAGRKAFEVLNLGVNAWGPMHERAFLGKFGTFDSDVVVICGPTADTYRPRYGLERLPFSPVTHPPSCAIEHVAYELAWRFRERTLGPAPWGFPGPIQDEQIREGIAAYAGMASDLRGQGIEVLMEMLPARPVTLGQGGDPEGARIFDAVRKAMKDAGTTARLAGAIFKDAPDKQSIYHDGIHFDVAGHRLYARYLAKSLRNNSAKVRDTLSN